jgi:large subunit ribosomal protein L18
MNKKLGRLRRLKKTRAKIREFGVLRLTVFRTPRHIYAQVSEADGSTVKVSASSVESVFHGKYMGNVDGAKVIGKLIAERAQQAGITQVAFDRSGFKYHGRVKALADAAREGGLEF